MSSRGVGNSSNLIVLMYVEFSCLAHMRLTCLASLRPPSRSHCRRDRLCSSEPAVRRCYLVRVLLADLEECFHLPFGAVQRVFAFVLAAGGDDDDAVHLEDLVGQRQEESAGVLDPPFGCIRDDVRRSVFAGGFEQETLESDMGTALSSTFLNSSLSFSPSMPVLEKFSDERNVVQKRVSSQSKMITHKLKLLFCSLMTGLEPAIRFCVWRVLRNRCRTSSSVLFMNFSFTELRSKILILIC